MKIPTTNAWMETCFPQKENPHKLIIVAKPGARHRELKAKLFILAAEMERRTPDRYKWCINVDGVAHYGNDRKAMSIHIELGDESMDEFYAAEGLIQDLACELGNSTLIL